MRTVQRDLNGVPSKGRGIQGPYHMYSGRWSWTAGDRELQATNSPDEHKQLAHDYG